MTNLAARRKPGSSLPRPPTAGRDGDHLILPPALHEDVQHLAFVVHRHRTSARQRCAPTSRPGATGGWASAGAAAAWQPPGDGQRPFARPLVRAAALARFPFLAEPGHMAATRRVGDPRRVLIHMLMGVEAEAIFDARQALRAEGVLAHARRHHRAGVGRGEGVRAAVGSRQGGGRGWAAIEGGSVIACVPVPDEAAPQRRRVRITAL